MSAASARREQAEGAIARELAAIAEEHGGALPTGYANRVYRSLQAAGVGIRRQDALKLIGEYAEYLQIPGRVSRAQPERFAPSRSAIARASKREAALDVVARMRRDGLSLTAAVREHNRERPDQAISADAVKRSVPRAIEQRGRSWRPTAFDRYARTTDAITTHGIRRVTVRDSRTASLIGRHAAAVRAYVAGDADEGVLRPFRGKRFRAGKITHVLETDPAVLERLAQGGELDELEIGSSQDLVA
jgi:hypothetical protein